MDLKIIASVLSFTLASAALAQAPATPSPQDSGTHSSVAQREANRQKRVEQGVSSGQLTPRETANIQKREAKLDTDKAAAKADGKVTFTERQQLRRDEKQVNHAIQHQKHDRQRVAPAGK